MPSVIVLDNAPYHFIMEKKEFNPNKATVQSMKEWLRKNNIHFNDSLLRNDLKSLCKKYWEKPKNILEEELKSISIEKFGVPHILLYLPPYHPELNPIELCWARMKKFLADNPCYRVKKLEEQLIPQAMKLISSSFLSKNIFKCN